MGDSYNNPYNNSYSNNYNEIKIPRKKTSDIFASVALGFGVVSLISGTTILLPLFFGSLGIILAVLSKGSSLKMNNLASIGCWCSILGLLTAVIVTSSSIYMYMNNSDYHDKFNETYEKMYGISFDESWQQNVIAPLNMFEEN